jgi:hypothetical protein
VFVWHVPLLLYLVTRLAEDEKLPDTRTLLAAVALVVLAAVQSPYFASIALQLVLLASLRGWLAGRREVAKFGLLLAVVGGVALYLAGLNVRLHERSAGPNVELSPRNLEPLVSSGLRVPDLFFPFTHPIRPWSDFAQKHYFDAGNPLTEYGSAFLGLLGSGLMVGLLVTAVSRAFRGRWREVPWQAWVIVYVLLFSIVGGLDYVLGVVVTTSLPATTRYSVVISCALLLWGADLATNMRSHRARVVVIAVAALFGCFELFGMRGAEAAEQDRTTRDTVRKDREFVWELERQVRAGASVFQLPVTDFPSQVGHHRMGSCEHFRPFLWTESLKFSFGTDKGRPREAWQRKLPASASDLVKQLRERQFSALMLNRKGFPDAGQALEKDLSGLARRITPPNDSDLVAFDISGPAEPAHRRIAFRFFPQGPSDALFSVANGTLVDPDGWVASAGRTSAGTYSITLRVPVRRVLSIQVTAQNVAAVDAFARLFDVLYEGKEALFAFRINNVEGGALADMIANPHNSIMVTMEVETQ